MQLMSRRVSAASPISRASRAVIPSAFVFGRFALGHQQARRRFEPLGTRNGLMSWPPYSAARVSRSIDDRDARNQPTPLATHGFDVSRLVSPLAERPS